MDLISLFSFSLAGVLYLLLHIVVTVHILLFKEDTKSAIGWIGLVWFAPIIGTILYILLGINRIHKAPLSLARQPLQQKLLDNTFKFLLLYY